MLFTDCRSADDARECTRVARPDTPEDGGLCGVASWRNSYMAYECTSAQVDALSDTVRNTRTCPS